MKQNPRIRLAIVSGRSLSDIKARMGLRGVHYSGNHGLEIEGPGCVWSHPGAGAALGDVQGVARDLSDALKAYRGTLLENKCLTLSVHYRGMPAKSCWALRELLVNSLRPYARSLMLASGKKTWEIRPRVEWNKGHALLRIARSVGRGSNLMFVGDDGTDEEGFRILKGRAITVRVGPTQESRANFHLRSQTQVHSLLELLFRTLT
jgi:trehalose-phosphatase